MKGLLSTFLIAASITLSAQIPVTDMECRNAATNFAQHFLQYRNITHSDIVSVYDYQENSKTLMKEVRFNNNLSIVLSGYKNCKPILLYSTDEEPILSEIDNLPIGLLCFIDNYCGAILYAADSLANDSISQEWVELLNPTNLDSLTRANIYGPYLKTRWGQSSSNDASSNDRDCNAYNFYVGQTSDSCKSCTSEKCPTGCIATAMAQIMNYWKYPVYSPSLLEQFDWCNMPDALLKRINNVENVNYEIERDAIAKLMAECGTAADMDYCCKETWYLSERCESFAFPIDARNALVNDFYYHSDADVKRRFYYTNSQWKRMLIHDIINERPVLYSGISYKNDSAHYSRGGHAFVCDGYDENTDKFHFNWGDKGNYDQTWCTIDSIIQNNNYYWNHFERAIFNIYPSSNQDYCDYSLPLQLHYNYYYTLLGNTTPPPHENVPKTMTHLISVPNENQYPSTWRTIPSGATSEYTAHKSVVLKDGFHAEAGSEFRAYITPCEQCETALRGNDESPKEIAEVQGIVPKESVTPTSLSGQGMTIHPNPNTGKFHITLCDKQDMVKQVAVFGILGSPMVMKNNPQSEDVDISRLPSGIYVVKVLTNLGNVYFEKVVKE
ncbi:MAG: C10 family peptidase [Bacteroidales bacterium]|nr:C10 family peptidase [Bacteroidales bacterium]